MRLKVASWNVNSIGARLGHLLQWLETAQPDILAVQETKTPDEDFPIEPLRAAGYTAQSAGQKAYNGVAIISKHRGETGIVGIPGSDDPQRRALGVRFGELYVLNLYVPNGAEVGSDKYDYKLRWFDRLIDYARELAARNRKILILGDFNVAPTDADVHDPAAWAGKVLVSAAEREQLRRLQSAGFRDCFRLFERHDPGFTWWDYRAGSFRRNHGMRIDLVLASEAMAACCRACTVDRAPRSWDRPSDHAPVVAEFEMH
jgi:exodeoxyribonuclease-3